MWRLLLVAAACGRVHFDPRGDGLTGAGDAIDDATGDAGQATCTQFGPWSAAQLSPVSTGAAESGPQLSPDGLTLYLDVTSGDLDLFVATRTTRTSPFGMPVALSTINTGADELCASVTADGLELVFQQGFGTGSCIRHSTRATVADNWGPSTPLALCASPVAGPYITSDGLHLLYFDASGATGGPLRLSTRPDRIAPFGVGTLVPGLEGFTDLGFGTLSADLRSVYFERLVGSFDVFEATRPDTSAAFDAPQSLPFNTGGTEGDPSLTVDGTEFYFVRDSDVYFATRTCLIP